MRNKPTDATLKQQLREAEFEYRRISVQLAESQRKINELERRINIFVNETKELCDEHEKEVS
jgi:septal ring factor EnvC (AmiA/AmiB activator)